MQCVTLHGHTARFSLLEAARVSTPLSLQKTPKVRESKSDLLQLHALACALFRSVAMQLAPRAQSATLTAAPLAHRWRTGAPMAEELANSAELCTNTTKPAPQNAVEATAAVSLRAKAAVPQPSPTASRVPWMRNYGKSCLRE